MPIVKKVNKSFEATGRRSSTEARPTLTRDTLSPKLKMNINLHLSDLTASHQIASKVLRVQELI